MGLNARIRLACCMTSLKIPVSHRSLFENYQSGSILSACFRLLQNTAFVVWLIVALVSMSLTASAWAAYATWKATQLTYRVAEMAYQHRRTMARAIAKARIRRLASAIPFVGAGAAVYFERQTYYE